MSGATRCVDPVCWDVVVQVAGPKTVRSTYGWFRFSAVKELLKFTAGQCVCAGVPPPPAGTVSTQRI